MTGNGGRVVSIADGVYYAFSYPYRIERFDNSGALQRVITRKHEAFEAPEAPKAVGGSIMGADLPNRISGIGVASNGIVVVQIKMEDKPSVLDFFSPEGKFLQSISLPDEHRLGAVMGNTLYTYVGGTGEQFASVTKWNLEIN